MDGQVFRSLDRDKDGVLRSNEVKQLFFNLGVKITDDDVHKLASSVSSGAAKEIDETALTQFMLECTGPSCADEATEVFRSISKSHKGLVTADEIRLNLESNGVALTEEEAGELVLQHKKRTDTPQGTLTLEEFIAMLSSLLCVQFQL